LLATGWELDRIHDLPALLDDAVIRNRDFEQFRELCETANAFYFAARYPFMVEPPQEDEIKNFFETTKELIEFILTDLQSRQIQ
jgi:hypothetical protein